MKRPGFNESETTGRLAMKPATGCQTTTHRILQVIALMTVVATNLALAPARSQAGPTPPIDGAHAPAPRAQSADSGARRGAYPARAVRWIIPYPAGASNDVVARLLAQKLSQIWEQPVVVENRSGAGGTIGANLVAKAEPDGYTLLMANPGSNATNFALGIETPYAARDFAHVILLGWAPIMLSVNANFPARTLAELIAMAKAEPGTLTGGSSGTGGSSHLALELFKLTAGVDIRHVPYKGAAPAVNDLAGGQITMVFTTPASVHALLQSGKLRALAVAGDRRISGYPDIPASAESGLGAFDDKIWFGVSVPAGTPADIIARINHDLAQAMQGADIRERLAALGLEPATSTPQEFADIIREDTERMQTLVRGGKISAD